MSAKRQDPPDDAPAPRPEDAVESAELRIRVARPLHVGGPSRLQAESLTPGYVAKAFFRGAGLHNDRSVTVNLSVDITGPPGEVPPFRPSEKKETP
jgi:hypothetical protein